MWAIINKDNKYIATINCRPNEDDLATRGERAIDIGEQDIELGGEAVGV